MVVSKNSCKIRPRVSAISEILNNYWHSKSLKAHSPPSQFSQCMFYHIHKQNASSRCHTIDLLGTGGTDSRPTEVAPECNFHPRPVCHSVCACFCIFSFSPQPVKADDRPPESGSAQGFSLTLLLHVCCGGICWSFGLIVQNALRRLGCDLALSKQMLID